MALVEVYGVRKFLLWMFLVCLLLAPLGSARFSFIPILKTGLGAFATVLTGFATGVFLVPALLRVLPMRPFAAKGLLAGAFTGLVPAVLLYSAWPLSLAQVMACSAFASWFAMHYTGSTPFTSLSGVDREMRLFMPVQGGLIGLALLVWLLWAWL